MTEGQNRLTGDCDRLSKLLDETAPRTAGERRFVEVHLAGCEVCRGLAVALEAMALTPAAATGPASPLDEVSRRRTINAVLDLLEGEDEVAAPEGSSGQEPASARQDAAAMSAVRTLDRTRGFWAVAALLTLATVVGAWVLWRHVSAPAPAPRLLMAAPERWEALGRVLRGAPGERTLRSGEAPMILSLPCGSRLRLAPRGQLVLVDVSEDRVRLRLERGRLLAAVSRVEGSRRFEVLTPGAAVRVKGTVFFVEVGRGESRVGVLRGAVDVQIGGRTPRRVGAGGVVEAAAGLPRLRELGAGRRKRMTRDLSLMLHTLDADPASSARLIIFSEPRAARVMLDKHLLGHTPLSAAVLPGDHMLSIEHRGQERVREQVSLASGEVSRRRYELPGTSLDRGVRRTSSSGSGPRPPDERAAMNDPSRAPGKSGPPRRAPVRRAASGIAASSVTGAPDAGSPVTLAAGASRPDAGANAAPSPAPAAAAQPGKRPLTASGAGTAMALLYRAQRAQAAGKISMAEQAYWLLLVIYPASPQARAARVSFGQMLLERGRDRRVALSLFETYLRDRPDGPLACEARFGRTRALRVLGRGSVERRALRQFLRACPGSAQAARARRRLTRLNKPRRGG